MYSELRKTGARARRLFPDGESLRRRPDCRRIGRLCRMGEYPSIAERWPSRRVVLVENRLSREARKGDLPWKLRLRLAVPLVVRRPQTVQNTAPAYCRIVADAGEVRADGMGAVKRS